MLAVNSLARPNAPLAEMQNQTAEIGTEPASLFDVTPNESFVFLYGHDYTSCSWKPQSWQKSRTWWR